MNGNICPLPASSALALRPGARLLPDFWWASYQRGGAGATGEGRLIGSNPFGNQKFTDRNWRVLDILQKVAVEADRPPAQVALAWASAQPGITSLILGASKVEQLHDNIASLEINLNPEQLKVLEEGSALDPVYPYPIFSPKVNQGIFGGETVEGWQ